MRVELRNIMIGAIFLLTGAVLAMLPLGPVLLYEPLPPTNAALRWEAPTFHPGIYAFYDWDNLSPAEYPWLTGGVIVRRWNQISKGPGTLDWSPLDSWIDREAKEGKQVILRVSPHDGLWRGQSLDGTPEWLYEEGVPKVDLSDGTTYPQYWHPVYREYLKEFIAELGARYDSDPRIEAVEMGVGLYGEAFPGPEDPAWERAGLTESLWVAYVKEMIDAYAEAFLTTPVIFMEQSYPRGDYSQMGVTTDYAADRLVNIGFNGLRAEDENAWSDNPLIKLYGWHSAFGKWVASGLRLGRFEAHGAFNDPRRVYWAVLNALDSGATYLSLYQVDVTDHRNQEAFEFAQEYLGKSIYDTPSVWVALRSPTRGLRYPKPGNYSFGLSQHDPEGSSIALWNVGGKEGLFARRTDVASSKHYLSFGIDRRYLNRLSSSRLTISVTYLDSGTDTWELQYRAIDDPHRVAGTVTKTGTDQWKDETFILEDAFFDDRQRGGSDFRLYSGGDEDDIFHLITVTSLPHLVSPEPGDIESEDED